MFERAYLIELKSQKTDSGVLTIVDGHPFQPQRAFWIEGLKKDSVRGNHAHRELKQLVICMEGHLLADILTPNDVEHTTFAMDSVNNRYLYVPPMNWLGICYCEIETKILVLADAPYDELDYIRSFDEFKSYGSTIQ